MDKTRYFSIERASLYKHDEKYLMRADVVIEIPVGMRTPESIRCHVVIECPAQASAEQLAEEILQRAKAIIRLADSALVSSSAVGLLTEQQERDRQSHKIWPEDQAEQ